MPHAIWFSVWVSSVTVVVALLIGGGLALLEHYWSITPARWFSALMVLPIFLPPAVVAVGFISAWGQTGYINTVLQWLHLPKVHILYSPLAIMLSYALYNIPLAYLAVHARLQTMSQQLEQTVSSLGGSRWQAWRIAVWPRLRSTILGISVIIFLYSFVSFALPLILGGVRYQTVEVYIYSLITQQLNFRMAVLVALGQWCGLTLIIALSLRNLTTLAEHQLHLSTTSTHRRWITVCQAILASYILLPLVGIVSDSFHVTNFVKLAQTQFWSAWQRSFVMALVVTIVTILIASLIAIYNTTWLNKLALLFLAISPVTLGLLTLLLVGKSLIVLTLVYIVSLLPLVGYLLMTAWQARPNFFDTTLTILGADINQRWKLNFSWLRPNVIQAASLSMAFVLGDITLANLLAPYKTPLAMSLSASYINSYHFNLATAGMVVVLGTIIVIVMTVNYARH